MLFMMRSSLKITDVFIILFAAALVVFSSYAAYVKPQGAERVLIRAQGREWTFPLDTEETVFISGPLGNTVVRINDNCAWVESSPCQNQTCVASGKVRRHGSWAACLPNNVLLVIEGTKEKDVDAVVW
ncbi:MAG: NusG domain II-containing protein [Treponema sp.]|jgi:hypothetical protein|nr:NusG domain II-containing protein [Treponema sp.]